MESREEGNGRRGKERKSIGKREFGEEGEMKRVKGKEERRGRE